MVGLLTALRSGAFLLGALLTPWAVRHLGAGPTLMIGVVLMGGVWRPFPFLKASMPGVVALLAVEHLANGCGNPMGHITISTLRQRVTPDHLLGRMTASYRFIARSAMPLGSLCRGPLGTWLGLRPTLVVAATGLLLGALWLTASTVLSVPARP
jgi:hypothetical protein